MNNNNKYKYNANFNQQKIMYIPNVFAFSSPFVLLSEYFYPVFNIPVLGGNRINGYIQISLEVSLDCSKVSLVPPKRNSFAGGDAD